MYMSDASQSQDKQDPLKKWGHIKSFVHRRAHMTPGQKDAMDRLFDQWSIPYQEKQLNFETVFQRQAPTILEIGFGMGETTEKIALAQPQHNFLGVEVFNAGVGAMLKRIEDSSLNNLRIIQHDAVDIINHMIPDQSLAGVHIFFPDPWRKKRHHKRRLIQGPFIQSLASKLTSGAYLHCATDWENYAYQMLDVLSQEESLKNTAQDFAEKPNYRPQTKFETRGLRLGHGVWDLVFIKQ